MLSREGHLQELCARLEWLIKKIDPKRGLNSAMVREARTMLWAIKDIARNTNPLSITVDDRILQCDRDWDALVEQMRTVKHD